MTRWNALVVVIALALTACSEDWVVIRIFPGFSNPDVVVPTELDSVLVEVVASLNPNEPQTCTASANRFSTVENSLEFPIEVIITPNEDRDWTLIAVRVTAHRGGTNDGDAVIRTERLFRPNFEEQSVERIFLEERCHADQGGELPCRSDQQCVIGGDEVVRCEPSGVSTYFEVGATVRELCEGD